MFLLLPAAAWSVKRVMMFKKKLFKSGKVPPMPSILPPTSVLLIEARRMVVVGSNYVRYMRCARFPSVYQQYTAVD